MRLASIILAEGEDTRFASRLHRMLHPLAGKPAVQYVRDAALDAGAEQVVLVAEQDSTPFRQALGEEHMRYVQADRRGPGCTFPQARAVLQDRFDLVLVCYGDMPLLRSETLRALIETQQESHTALAVLVPAHDDAQPAADRATACGACCFDSGWLWSHAGDMALDAGQACTLADVVRTAISGGASVEAISPADPDEMIQIETRVHLALAKAIVRRRINERLMLEGVTLQDPGSTYIDATVHIGQDTVILANTHISGETTIGQGSTVGPNSIVRDCTIGDRCRVTASVLEEAVMEDDCDIGPFGHLRPGARLCVGAHMGNFGEVKNATLGPGAKMGHVSYLGDTVVGAGANIGAGTITCNYDGQRKHRTTIGADAFIGSGSMLVAPLSIGKGAKTGAGSVVTHDVPNGTVVYGVPARPAPDKGQGS